MKFAPGQVVRFTYRFHMGAGPEEPTDDHKEVLVLNPNFQGKLHAIDMKRLTAAEREVLLAIFDPAWKGKRHRLPLVNDINRRMDVLQEVKSPYAFYNKFVKVFLRNKDAYRTYFPVVMVNSSIVKQTEVEGKPKPYNPKPLFHAVKSKPGQKATVPTQKLPLTARSSDVIRQRAQVMKDKMSGKTPPAVSKQDRLNAIKQRMSKLNRGKCWKAKRF